ncbi:hypothetical protein [Sphingobacterium pedocola]|uniref:Uncharacterized protein n=1 Tax=Sphingobacterium pedocola TaxID=2082722 RepID=A0ABR9T315_9SPHI|nr:hypothetical protein [Sphingobacterium pedocola]MBE8719738.1 hypothetical protein [Sphingobacterium pedocola]
MKPLIYLLFVLVPFWSVAQDTCQTCISDILKKELKGYAKRGTGSPCVLKFDRSATKYNFSIADLPIDSRLQQRIDSSLSTACYHCVSDSLYLVGYIKFDDYSDAIFVQLTSDTISDIYTSVEIGLEPSSGMDKFMDRWVAYVDSMAVLGSFSYELVQPSTYVHFDVERDGSLIKNDTSAFGKLLSGFIKYERRWSPGILSGRPVAQTIYLAMPTEKGKKPLYHRHSRHFYKGRVGGDLYYSYVLPDFPYVDNVVSVVPVDGKYSTPVVHKGSNSDRIIDVVMDKSSYRTRSNSCFGREYFYTLDR